MTLKSINTYFTTKSFRMAGNGRRKIEGFSEKIAKTGYEHMEERKLVLSCNCRETRGRGCEIRLVSCKYLNNKYIVYTSFFNF